MPPFDVNRMLGEALFPELVAGRLPQPLPGQAPLLPINLGETSFDRFLEKQFPWAEPPSPTTRFEAVLAKMYPTPEGGLTNVPPLSTQWPQGFSSSPSLPLPQVSFASTIWNRSAFNPPGAGGPRTMTLPSLNVNIEEATAAATGALTELFLSILLPSPDGLLDMAKKNHYPFFVYTSLQGKIRYWEAYREAFHKAYHGALPSLDNAINEIEGFIYSSQDPRYGPFAS